MLFATYFDRLLDTLFDRPLDTLFDRPLDTLFDKLFDRLALDRLAEEAIGAGLVVAGTDFLVAGTLLINDFF
jgi:hypothetical protein